MPGGRPSAVVFAQKLIFPLMGYASLRGMFRRTYSLDKQKRRGREEKVGGFDLAINGSVVASNSYGFPDTRFHEWRAPVSRWARRAFTNGV
jgi:hypothetical protein